MWFAPFYYNAEPRGTLTRLPGVACNLLVSDVEHVPAAEAVLVAQARARCRQHGQQVEQLEQRHEVQ